MTSESYSEISSKKNFLISVKTLGETPLTGPETALSM